MSNNKDEDNEPKTLEDAILIIVYHSGVFFFKVTAIVVGWLLAVELLKKWLVP